MIFCQFGLQLEAGQEPETIKHFIVVCKLIGDVSYWHTTLTIFRFFHHSSSLKNDFPLRLLTDAHIYTISWIEKARGKCHYEFRELWRHMRLEIEQQRNELFATAFLTCWKSCKGGEERTNVVFANLALVKWTTTGLETQPWQLAPSSQSGLGDIA